MTELDLGTKVFGDDPSGRFQVMGRSDLPIPGACATCGSGDSERTYVFLGVHFDFHGALILCNMCIVQVSELVGCMAPVIAERIHLQAVELAETNKALRAENEALHDRLEVFDAAIRGITDRSASASMLTSDPSHTINAGVPLPDETAQPDITEQQSKPAEPVKDDGSSQSSGDAASDITAKPRRVRRKSSSPSL